MQGLETVKGVENILKEIITENFPNLGYNIQVQEGKRSPVRFNSTKSTSRYLTTKLSNAKDKRDS